MLARPARLVLLSCLLAAALAAPAQASHPPPQDADKWLTMEEALIGSDFTQQIRASASTSFECVDGMAGPYPCKNIDLEGFVPLPMLGGATGNDIWGWTDPESGNEYAIMGTSHSTAFVDVTDPKQPSVVGILPTAGVPDMVLWRTVRVDGHYAFIASEITDHGVQVFDLHKLREPNPAAPLPQIFTEDAHYDGVSNTHTVWIDEPNDTMYLVGTNTCGINGENGGLHMVDISNPLEPTFAGCATQDTFASEDEPNNYVHETWCETYHGPDTDYQGREICFGSNENAVVIYDVTDKANPRVVSETTYPTAAYTHQGSPTKDHRYFLFNDELDEQSLGIPTTTYILDISDLDAPPTPVGYEHPSATIDHNAFVHGNRQFQSNYSEGLRILEFDDASLAAGQLTEVAYFDVLPQVDIAEFAGTWSNFRFPGSGNVVVSLIENEINGLMVLKPALAAEPTAAGPAAGGPSPQPAKAKAKKCKKAKRKGKKRKGKKRKRRC